jgi:branched-chain amino acid transport system substrate-binding protein
MKHGGLLLSAMVIVLVLVVLTAGCFQTQPAATTQAEPIKIGQLCDLTGYLSVMGVDAKDAVELRMEEAGWKVAGRPIELVFDDTATDTATTMDKAKKQVERDGVKIIIGPLNSADSMALAPYCAANKVLDIAVHNHPLDISKFGWTIVPPGSLEQATYPMGLYAYDKMGFRNVVMIGWDYVAGYLYQAGFEKAFESKGGKVVQKIWVPMGAADFSSFLPTIQTADAAILWICDPDLTRFFGQYIEYGMFNKMPLHQSLSECFYWETKPAFADQTVGFSGAAPYTWTLDNPMNKEFVAAFEQKFKKKPTVYNYFAYESASIVLDLLNKTNGDTTPEKLRQAIIGLKLDTPSGPVSIGPDGFGIRNVYIVKIDKIDDLYDYKAVDVYKDFQLPAGFSSE